MATAEELLARWRRRDFVLGVAGLFGMLVFFSPLFVDVHSYIDFEELTAAEYRFLLCAWLAGVFLPFLLAHLAFKLAERVEDRPSAN
jgi:hypothetical protein